MDNTDVATHLQSEHGHWGEHAKYPVRSWQYEVANGDTRSGYWSWVAEQIAAAD
jgi:hypothetical protein